MRELLTTQELYSAVAEMVLSGIIVYMPDENFGSVYYFEEHCMVIAMEMENFSTTFCSHVDNMSKEVAYEMFRAMDKKRAKAFYEIKIADALAFKEEKWISCYLKYMEDKRCYIIAVETRDVNSDKNLKLFEETREDSLTKLINKAYSTQMISNAIKRSGKGCLMIVDIDNFKSVNDTMGHFFGDQMIVSVANGLKKVFRAGDIIGRIGGDEFIVYLDGVADGSVIQKKAEAVCDTVCSIYTGQSDKVKISASVGIAVIPDDGTEYNDIFKKADHALYYTKNLGKNGYSFYDRDNEAMHKYQGLKIQERDVEHIEEQNSEMNAFYFELNQLAFRMLEEVKDIGNAVNLIMNKIQNKFGFSFIRIFEPKSTEMDMVCTYEICGKNVPALLEKKFHYTEAEWIRLNSHCSTEPFVYRYTENETWEGQVFRSKSPVKSGVIISFSRNNCFAGAIFFGDISKERSFSSTELRILKSFERLFSVYKVQENSIADSNYYLREFTERDNLTGLYMYQTFRNKLEHVIYSLQSDVKLLYVCMDIAHFKYINESYGYEFGNKILKYFTDVTCASTRYLLYASRIYGDNFIAVYVLPASLTEEKIVAKINMQQLLNNKLLQQKINSPNFYVNCGACITNGNDHKFDSAITKAQYAAKLAKQNGDGKCVLFRDEMYEEQRRKMRLLDEFGDALRFGQFKVFYQPMIDSISKMVVGAEALSRWVREDGTVLMPNEYVPTLEEANKLTELDYYVIDCVFEFIHRQTEKGETIVPISINLCGGHLDQQREFFLYLSKLLKKYQVSAEYIFFEMKEKIFLEHLNEAVDFCNKLAEMGIRTIMDSFGSGYSELNILARIPVVCIKTNPLFWEDKIFEKTEQVILSGVVDVVKKLNKHLVSMAVETREQNAFACECGCDMIQGNYYARPLEEEKLLKYIEEHKIPEENEAFFSFDGTFEANEGVYSAWANGKSLDFAENQAPGRKVLKLPGGTVGHEIVEISLGNLLVYDFTISIWYKESEVNVWSSLFYADYENGFISLMPKAWNGVSVFRVMDKYKEAGFYDAVGTRSDMDGWIHLAAVYNAETHSSALFVNGFLSGYQNDIVPLHHLGRVALGGDVYQKSLCGYVANLYVTNKVLSAEEIRRLYDQEKIIFTKPENKNEK